jgi:GH15 family glucan-1,4-alpha-glucosidase
MRAGRRRFLHSALTCWVALDRGLRLARDHAYRAPVERWEKTTDAIRRTILTEGSSDAIGAFTQTLKDQSLDASVPAIPRTGFLPPTDPRVLSTIRRIQADLAPNGWVLRYNSHDGLPGGQGSFALCTLWLVDALALSGLTEESHSLFERVLARMQVIAVNLRGPFLCSQAAARQMVRLGSGGTIVNISSVHEDLAFPGYAGYPAAKGGLMRNTGSL